MVDYDAAVAAVQDPNADPILLAKIAYENPEFGANVAVNPRCYPGLKRWIAEFGDDRARETLAQYGSLPRHSAARFRIRKPRHRRPCRLPSRLSSPRLRRHSRSLWPPILTVSPPNRP
mgnify:CR=1 FL=1